MNIFVSSTDSDAGKTMITAGLAAIMQSLSYKMGVLKPVQVGAEEKLGFLISPDITFIKNIDPYIECICSYTFKTPAAPAIAAELEKIKIDPKVFLKDYKTLEHRCDTVIVEGADGLLVPITSQMMMADLIKLFNIPVLFVVTPQLGNINSTLLTLNQAKTMGIKTIGVVINKYPFYMNDIAIKSVPRLIEEYSDAKILGIVKEFPKRSQISPSELISLILNSVDIEKIFDVPIPKLSLGI